MRLSKALLIVDVQNDFCPGGALAVGQAEKIIPALNKYSKLFYSRKLPIFASRDWHPKKTKHFRRFGGTWGAHCVQGTKGAEFNPKLKLPRHVIIISKGMGPDKDSYSAFQAQDPNGEDFLNLLKIFGVKELYVGGLASDYCVKWTVLDALKLNFRVRLLTDAIKGVNINEEDSREAIAQMLKAGAKKITFKQVSRELA